ncbi:MAG: hypothetical protein JXP73_10245 [Deltaproteobacteria bacterium]|nr:hypothetical protein [Deltaproteobacteria bacterium]
MTATLPESPVLLDVRGNLTLAVLAFDCWSIETLGRTQGSLDANVKAWEAAGRPQHGQVDRVVARLRGVVARLGEVPAWLPPALAEMLSENPPALTGKEERNS